MARSPVFELCRQGEKLVQEVMNNWSQVAEWWTAGASGDLQGLAVLLLTKVLLVDSKVRNDPLPPSPTVPPPLPWYFDPAAHQSVAS